MKNRATKLIHKIKAQCVVIMCILSYAHGDYSIASKDSVRSFFGTDHVKTVFVLDNKLCYVDFSEATPQVRTITAVSGPANPVLSPQGTTVTYSTGLQSDPPTNSYSPSTAWLCSLSVAGVPQKVDSPAYVPRFVQNATDPTVLYSTCGNVTRPSAHEYDWDGCGKVFKRNMTTGEKSVTWDKGSWFGGLSYDNKWLATAEMYPNAFLIDISAPSPAPAVLHTLTFTNKTSGKDTLIPVQTCNPSVSSSRIFPDAIMYFDFSVDMICENGNYVIHGFGQDNGWLEHTNIFIARSNGKIVKWFPVPDEIQIVPQSQIHGNGEITGKKWNYPEWSNHPYYAAATVELDRYWSALQDTRTLNEMVYGIDLHTSQHICLVKQNAVSSTNTQDIRWPWLWVETPIDFGSQEDSTWLSNSVGVRLNGCGSAQPDRRLFVLDKDRGIRLVSPDVQAVRFYTMDGRCVRTVCPHPNGRVSLGGLPPATIARFVMLSGASFAVRIVVIP